MTLKDFQARLFPEKSVFDRKQFDRTTNFVKWFAIPVAYLFFRLRISANLLDVFGIFFSLVAFLFLSTAVTGEKILPLVGILIVYFHIFIDFVDGAIAKAAGKSSRMGHYFDSLGCDMDRFALIVLFGIYAGSTHWIISNVLSACVFTLFLPLARHELPQRGFVGGLCRVYANKFSFLSVRIMLVVLPLVLATVIFLDWNLPALARFLSYFYGIMAVCWLVLCTPHYTKET